MFDALSNLFGYVLNFIYNIVGNYGVAIILFTILLKLVMLPLTYKQQVTMKKTAKIQDKVKTLQFKYKNDPEKLGQETMALYKREKINPLGGCFSGIIQLVILLSLFYLVRSPLTYMRKIDSEVLNSYIEEMRVNENTDTYNTTYPEISLIREKGNEIEELNINMEFLGLDLSLIPCSSYDNPVVYIIPVLYVISSIISMKISTSVTNAKKTEEEENGEEKQEGSEVDTVEKMNKNMMYVMPVMSVLVSMLAPLGLALYWLVNNILITTEKLVIDKIINKDEEVENDA